MHYYLLASLFFLSFFQYTAPNNSCATTSHTFFRVRPQFQVGSPEYLSTQRKQQKVLDDTSYALSFDCVLMGGRSTHAADVGAFFMPFGASCTTVDGTLREKGIALFPQHFNIFSIQYTPFDELFLPPGLTNITNPFKSTFSLEPRQTVVGLGFLFNAWFKFCDYAWFITLSAPLMSVRNNVHLCESVQENSQFYDVEPLANQETNLNKKIRTMKEAFVQDCWCFGKIPCDSKHKTRLAFIQCIGGVHWLSTTDCSVASGLGITIPTGNKPKGKYVFEPIVGNGGHWGLILTHSMHAALWKSCDEHYQINVHGDGAIQYLFKKTHTRSFDLKHKPWSRYIELYANKIQAEQANQLGQTTQSLFLATPGINILTQECTVKPGFNITANIALALSPGLDCGWYTEVGYNFYAQESECLSLKNCNPITAAIKDHLARGIVNPIRTMTNEILSNEAAIFDAALLAKSDEDILEDYAIRALTIQDIDLLSATHPCTISHTIYAAGGYQWNTCYPITAGIGASYEFSGASNTALDRWLIWMRAGITF